MTEIEFENGSTIKAIDNAGEMIRSMRGNAYHLAMETGRSFDDCYYVLKFNKGDYDKALNQLQELNMKGE